MVKHADAKIIATKEEVYSHGALETGGMPGRARPLGEGLGQESEAHRVRVWPLLGFLRGAVSDTG